MGKRSKARRTMRDGSAHAPFAAPQGGSPADLLGEASRLFAASRYDAVRALAESALAAYSASPAAAASSAAHELQELRYVLAASLVKLGDHAAARAVIAHIRERAPEHPGAALQEIYIEKAEGRTRTEMEHLTALIAWLKARLAESLPTEFAVCCRKFLAESYSLLGSARTFAGRAAEGAAAFLAASRQEADGAQRIVEYSNALFVLNYVAEEERMSFAGLLAGFDDFFRREDRVPLALDRRIHARLRVGYISPDLRCHAVAFFLLPLLRAFDRRRFEVFCYANNREDAVSRTMAQQDGVVWRNILGLSPARAAELIAGDEIDILVDLSGHTSDNCLPVLARKPAPLQITGIGYMGRTGLSAVDYVLGDMVLDTAEGDDGESERPLRLPHSHLCYLPFVAMPKVAPPPAWAHGFITFGCFNNYSKVTDAMLLLWRRLLQEVSGARLLLKSRLFGSEEGRSLAMERFARLGLDVSRIELRGFSKDYLDAYAEVDIALDTFPYTGGLTTCEALYMGVPVVTLRGASHGARFGASLLQNAGLPELIAESAAQYVEIAKLLANSPETRKMLRENQRDILLASPLMNFRQYVKEVEAAYETVWERWRSGQS